MRTEKENEIKSTLKKLKLQEAGITLIALVVTIIVLLVLAGVSISTLSGDNGLIARAGDAKRISEKAALIEKVQADIMAEKLRKKSSSIDRTTLKDILEEYFINVPPSYEIDQDTILPPKDGGEEIKFGDIYDGKIDAMVDANVDITITGNQKQTSMPIVLTATVTVDGKSEKQAKYKLTTTNDNLGTDETSYTNTIDGTGNIEVNGTDNWYIHVLITDKYGRKIEKVKGPISITAQCHKHTGTKSTNGGCYTTPVKHSHSGSCYKQERCYWKASDNHGARYTSCGGCGGKVYRNHQSTEPHFLYYCAENRLRTVLNCSISTSKVDHYDLSCGKTEETIEIYKISY